MLRVYGSLDTLLVVPRWRVTCRVYDRPAFANTANLTAQFGIYLLRMEMVRILATKIRRAASWTPGSASGRPILIPSILSAVLCSVE